jgi:hypothetical protein
LADPLEKVVITTVLQSMPRLLSSTTMAGMAQKTNTLRTTKATDFPGFATLEERC